LRPAAGPAAAGFAQELAMTDEFTFQRRYRVEISNGASDVVTPCLYWTIAGDASMRPVAWFSGAAAPTSRLVCEFDYVPGFFCVPAPLEAAGTVTLQNALMSRVDYAFNNSVQLFYAKSKFILGTPRPYGSREMLYLLEDASIPSGNASVGIMVGGRPALVTPSEASTMLSVPMSLQLNLAMANVARGTVLASSGLPQSSAIELPQNVVAMYVVIDSQGHVSMSQYPPRRAPAVLQESA
jgi:hypothetical protein